MAPPGAFANYPEPIQGPETEYETYNEKNPVLRGIPLVIGSRIVTTFTGIQKYLWTNSGMGTLRDIPELDNVPARLHPTVTPLGDNKSMIPFESDLHVTHGGGEASRPRYYSAADYHQLYKTGKLTPLQVAETLLGVITDPASQYADAWADSHGKDHLAIEAAKASTARYAEGKPLGILDGVPIGIKDDIAVKGYVNHNGMAYQADIPYFKEKDRTDWPVQKLEEAGAVIIGKNRMHECGSDTSGLNVAQGTPTNHLNTAYYPGGSTSGGCSALGAGIVPIVLGTDAGGSVRIPACYNGVYGLKTTHQRINDMPMSTVIVGPMAATAADLTISYRLIAQPNPDAASGRAFATSQRREQGAKRVMGVYRDWWASADPRVEEVCGRALEYFAKKNGYEIVDISIPLLNQARIAHTLLCVTELTEAARRRTPDPANWLDLVSSANKLLFSASRHTPAADYIKANTLREVQMRHFAYLFQKYPGLLIMSPTSPLIGWPRHPGDQPYGLSDTNTVVKSMIYIFLANLTGTPAVTVPVGYVEPDQGEGKMPVGLMAMSEWGAEEHLLEFAKEAEEYLHETYDGGRRRPETWFDVLGESAKE